jgi:hypothetical protein
MKDEQAARALSLLAQASDEIQILRSQLDRAHIRLKAIDDMLLLLNAQQPSTPMGYKEDISNHIDRFLTEATDATNTKP